MSKDREIYMGYPKESKNKDGKAQRHVVGETQTTFTLKVPAFTDNGKTFIGWDSVTVPKASPEGLKAFKANLKMRDLILRNRQEITDVRNDLAKAGEVEALKAKVLAGTATFAEISRVIKSLAKTNPEFAKELESKLIQALAGK